MPYGLIIGSYVCILRRIRKTRFRRHIRSEKLILVIVITFGLNWLPFHIMNMVEVREKKKKLKEFKEASKSLKTPGFKEPNLVVFPEQVAGAFLPEDSLAKVR